MDNPLLWGLVFIGILAIIFARLKQSPKPSSNGDFPYRRRDYLLTKAEKCFFDALRPAIGDSLHISVKPRLADLFFIVKGTGKYQSHFNRIKAKHVDFILCRPQDMRPVLAIELDDRSHQAARRVERDNFVDDLFSQTGLPLLRVKASNRYNVASLRQSIDSHVAES